MANDWESAEEIDAAAFVAKGEAAPGETPVRRVRITNLTPELVDAFVASPLLKHVTHLDLSGNKIGYQGTFNLLLGGQLDQLTHLDLSGNKTLNTIGELGQSNIPLRHLQDLRLADNGIDWTMMYELAILPLDRLQYLDVRGNDIGIRGAKELARSSHFQPEMTIAVDGFQGTFAEFKERTLRRPGRWSSGRGQ